MKCGFHPALSPEIHVLGVHVCFCVRKLGNDLVIRRQQEEPESRRNAETRALSEVSPQTMTDTQLLLSSLLLMRNNEEGNLP